jgi:ferritin
MSSYTAAQLPQSYSPKAEKKINKLVHILTGVSYDYVAIIAHLRSEDEALDGARKFFKRRSELLQRDSQTLIKIQQKIGGTVIFKKLKAPSKQQFDSLEEILEYSLKKEKKISKFFLKLHSELVHVVEPRITQKIETILQHRDEVLQQIEQQLVHLQQNVGQVGEYQVSQYLEEDHSRSKVERLEKKLWENTTTTDSLPTIRMRQQLTGYKLPTVSQKRKLIRREVSSDKISYRKRMLLQ